MLKNLDDRYWFYFWKLFWNSFKMHTLRSQSGNIHISIIRSNQENIFYQCPLISLNTLHNTKRLGPFLGFGCNFGEKQNKCLKTDRKSVCLMWFVQVFCLFASWANPNHLVNYTQNPKTDPNKVYDVCPNLSVSRHLSCFTQKLYPKPKNGPKRLVLCKVFIK